MRYLIFATFLMILSLACQSVNTATEETKATVVGNPAADGFNAEASDETAIQWADKVMEAMGGRESWDTTRFLHWNFFGRRTLLWDKQEGKVRIESPGDSMTYLVDIFNNTGQVKKGDTVMSQADSIAKYVERGRRIWINDSYWLVMPFKLKDSGVSLNYIGQDTTLEGSMAEVLSLTFESVGVTPQNKYLVYIDPATNLVNQWDFFTNADDEAPRFAMPWKSYKSYGALKLSGDRGKPQLSDIAVLETVPASAFTTFDAVDVSQLQ